MKPQIETSLQGTAHHNIFPEADKEHSHERAEEPAGMTEIIHSQIHDFFAESVRQSEGREQVKHDGLEQKDRELKKGPGMSIAISKHRPPCLDVHDDEEKSPSNSRPVDADAVPRIDYLAKALEQLSHAQTENDGENDLDVTKLIHRVASALSLGKALVDNRSLLRQRRSLTAG